MLDISRGDILGLLVLSLLFLIMDVLGLLFLRVNVLGLLVLKVF